MGLRNMCDGLANRENRKHVLNFSVSRKIADATDFDVKELSKVKRSLRTCHEKHPGLCETLCLPGHYNKIKRLQANLYTALCSCDHKHDAAGCTAFVVRPHMGAVLPVMQTMLLESCMVFFLAKLHKGKRFAMVARCDAMPTETDDGDDFFSIVLRTVGRTNICGRTVTPKRIWRRTITSERIRRVLEKRCICRCFFDSWRGSR